MKLEKQICSLEHAKKLKELGVKQESEWIWAIMNIGAGQSAYIYNTVGDKGYYRDVEYSAYTVAELGELLPENVLNKNCSIYLDMSKIDNDWYINYRAGCIRADISMVGVTEADARALMLIYLLRNKLIKG